MDLGKKVLTSWVNHELANKKVKISNLETDFSDGSLLITLVETLLNKQIDIPKASSSDSREHKIETITKVFNYLSQHAGINIAIPASDIVDGSIRSTVMLLLLLVTHFHVEAHKNQGSKESSKIFLLNWCKSQAAPSGLPVNNFASLQDGRVLGYILHSKKSKFIDYNSLKEGHALENITLVLKAAEKHLGVPPLMDPQDFVKADDLSILIYTSLLYSKIVAKSKGKGHKSSSSSSSSSSSDDGTQKKKLKVSFGSVLSACPVCVNNITTNKVTCSQCNQNVCEGCGSKFQSKILGWDQSQFVCNNCLPLLKEKWFEEKRQSMAVSQADNPTKLHGSAGLSVGMSGNLPDIAHAAHAGNASTHATAHTGNASTHAGNALTHAAAHATPRSAHISLHAGHATDSHPTKIGKKLQAVEWQQEIINAKTRCTYCGSGLSLLRRPHKCTECSSIVCSTCSNINFVSFVLNWKKPKRICQKCISGPIKMRIHAKVRENPQLKEQADKEIRDISDWLNLNPTLRLKNRKDGKDGSESSPSSLSSSPSSDNGSADVKMRKVAHTISVPASPKPQISGSEPAEIIKPKPKIGFTSPSNRAGPTAHAGASPAIGRAGVSAQQVHASVPAAQISSVHATAFPAAVSRSAGSVPQVHASAPSAQGNVAQGSAVHAIASPAINCAVTAGLHANTPASQGPIAHAAASPALSRAVNARVSQVHVSEQDSATAPKVNVNAPHAHAQEHGFNAGIVVPQIHAEISVGSGQANAPAITSGVAKFGGSVPKPDPISASGVAHHAAKKTKEQKKEIKLEWKLRSIQGGKKCHFCSSPFTLTKRPHKCKECSNEVCSSCVYPHFTLPFLGYVRPNNLCINCILNLKTKISPKVKENPELRAEAVKGLKTIVDWVNMAPHLRVQKRKDGKDGSPSSSSSSSSSSESDSDKKKKVAVSPKAGANLAAKMEIEAPKSDIGLGAKGAAVNLRAPPFQAHAEPKPEIDAPKLDTHAKVSAGASPQVPRPEVSAKVPAGKSNLALKTSGSALVMPKFDQNAKLGAEGGVKLNLELGGHVHSKTKEQGSDSDEEKKKAKGLKLEGDIQLHAPKAEITTPKSPKPEVALEGHVTKPKIEMPASHSAIPRIGIKLSGKAKSGKSSSSSDSEDDKKKAGSHGKMKSPRVQHANSSKDLKSGKVECSICRKGFGMFKKSYTCHNCYKLVCDNCSHEYRSKVIFEWHKRTPVCIICLPVVKYRWLEEYNAKIKANPTAMFFDASDEAPDFISQVPIPQPKINAGISLESRKGHASSSSSSSDDEDSKRGRGGLGVKLDLSTKGKSEPDLRLKAEGSKLSTPLSARGDAKVPKEEGGGRIGLEAKVPKEKVGVHFGFDAKIPKLGNKSSSSSEDDGTGQRVKKVTGGAKIEAHGTPPKMEVAAPHVEGGSMAHGNTDGGKGGLALKMPKFGAHPEVSASPHADAKLAKPEGGAKVDPHAKGGFGLHMPKFGKDSSSSSEDDGTGKRVKKPKGVKVGANVNVTAPKSPHVKGGAKGEIKGDAKVPNIDAHAHAKDTGGGLGLHLPKFGFGHSCSSSEDDGTGKRVKKVKGPKVEANANLAAPKVTGGGKEVDVKVTTPGKEIELKGGADLKASGGANLHAKGGVDFGAKAGDASGKSGFGFGIKVPKFGKDSHSSSSSEDDGHGNRVKKVKAPKVDAKMSVEKVDAKPSANANVGFKVEGLAHEKSGADLKVSGDLHAKGGEDSGIKGGIGLKMPKFGLGGDSSSSSEDDGTGKRVKKVKAPKVDAKGPKVGGEAKIGGDLKISGDVHAKGGADAGAKGGFGLKMPKFGLGGDSSSSSEDDGTRKRVKKVRVPKSEAKSGGGAKVGGDLKVSPSVDLTIKGEKPHAKLPGIGGKRDKKSKLEWKKIAIESGKECFVCNSKFSLTKRPHQCKECAAEVCSSCTCASLTSVVLGWKKPRPVCVNCCVGVKLQIAAKVKENPELKADAARELQFITDWVAKPPHLRIAKRKDGKEGSESSSSSSSSSDDDTHKRGPEISAKIPKPATKGECQICLKTFGMFKRPLSCFECEKTVCDGCSEKFYSKLVFGWEKSNIICFSCLPTIKTKWYDEYKHKLALDSSFHIGTEHESGDFMGLLSELKKESSTGKIGADISVAVSKPKLESKMSRRTLDLSVRRTKEEKSQAKMRWKKMIIDAKGDCTACSTAFSVTKRPHECKMCGMPVCSSCCFNTSLVVILGWSKSKKICIKCFPAIQDMVKMKIKEKPELKVQADKEIGAFKEWQLLTPALRIPKRKNGAGSDSSESSSSSNSDSERDKEKSRIGFGYGIVGGDKPNVKGGLNIGGAAVISKKQHKSKDMKIEWKNTAIADGKVCLGCQSKFSLTKRPHQCADCSGLFCSSCSTMSFTSILLGWKKPKRLCEKCVTSLKVKIEAQASFADKAQVEKELKELYAWLSLAPSLRVPKRKDGKSGSDTSSSSSAESSEDEKHKKLPPDCNICHKDFGIFKKSLLCFHCLTYVCESCSDKLHSKLVLGWAKPNVVCLSCLTAVKMKWKEEHSRKLKLNPSLTYGKDDESIEFTSQLSLPTAGATANININLPAVKVKSKLPEGKLKLKMEWRTKILNSGASCASCKTKFSNTRRPHECKECSTTVCSACSKGSFISFVLGWTHSHRLCVKCLPKMRNKIEAKVNYNPALKVKGDKELADIDTWLALSPAMRIPKRKDGKEGSESSDSSSSDDASVKGKIDADLALRAKVDLPTVKGKVEAPQSPPVATKGKLEVRAGNRNKRVSVKQDSIIRTGAVCTLCAVKFSFFRRPHQCKECKLNVCSGCSSGGIKSIVLNWGGKPRRVCAKCVADLKMKLEKRATLMPELKVQADKEVKELEYRISIKIEKKNQNPEESSSSSDSDGGGVGTKGKKPVIEYKPISLTCKNCKKNFGPTVHAAQCTNCLSEVCHSCVSSLHSKLLGWTVPKIICEECLPQIKAKWLAEKEKQLSLNSGFRIDPSAEAPLFTLFDAPKGGIPKPHTEGGVGLANARATLSIAGPSGIAKPSGLSPKSGTSASGGISANGGISVSTGVYGNGGISGSVGKFSGKVKKDKAQSKQLKLEFRQKAIAAGNGCTLCHSKFTLTKRPHKCAECNSEICSSCSHVSFTSFALGITRPRRVCEACVSKFKVKLHAKLLESPEMKEQIDKELRDMDDWVSLAPTLRIKKRADGKSGSESSPSSSSSGSASLKSPRGPKFSTASVSSPKVDPKLGGGATIGFSGGNVVSGPSISGTVSGGHAAKPSFSGSTSLGASATVSFGGETVLKEGIMKKQGGRRNRNKWSFRLFRLFPTCLRYYKDAKSTKPRGMLLLAEATVSTSDRKPFSFFVASPIKVVNIWPASKEERDEWMVSIKKVVRKPFDGVDLHAQLRSDSPQKNDERTEIKLGMNVLAKKDSGSSSSSSSSSSSDEGHATEVAGTVLKEGFLFKKSKNDEWKKCWIVLKSEGINIFAGNEKRKLKDGIAFDSVITTGAHIQKSYAFWIQVGNKKLIVHAATFDEQESWTAALQAALKK